MVPSALVHRGSSAVLAARAFSMPPLRPALIYAAAGTAVKATAAADIAATV